MFTLVAAVIQAGVMAVSVALLALVEKYKLFEDAKIPQKAMQLQSTSSTLILVLLIYYPSKHTVTED